MQTLFEADAAPEPVSTFGGYSTEPAEPSTESRITQRFILLVVMLVVVIGFAFAYSQGAFEPKPEKHLIEHRCTLNGDCTTTDLGRVQ